MASLRALLLGAALWFGTTAAHSDDDVYVLLHDVKVDGAMVGTLRHVGFSGVTLDTAEDASRDLHTWPLWSRQRGGGQTQTTDTLDPEDADERALLDVLAGGFTLHLAADGTAGALRAVDENAWRVLTERNPRAADLLTSQAQLAGLQPVALPPALRVGQTFVRRHTSSGFGPLTAHHDVLALTDAVAVLDTRLDGDGLRGHGRQALRRADGMPIEVRLHLAVDGRDDGTPPTTHQMYLASMASEPIIDLASSDGLQDDAFALGETLGAPPFSAPSEEASAYHLYPRAGGELEPWMVAADALPGMEAQLLFARKPNHVAARPQLVLGGQFGPPRPSGDDGTWTPQVLIARLRAVALLDGAGRALPGVDAVPVHRKLVLADDYRVDESDPMFPLRLPIGTRASQLDALDTIRFAVDVETYAWDGTEAVTPGTQSQRNPLARITWTSPRRLTVEQIQPALAQVDGLWSIPVPVDASGRELATARVTVPQTVAIAIDSNDSGRDTAPRLSWEQRQRPHRMELATREPIAALQLRHFRWQIQARDWTFRDAQTLHDAPDGGAPRE